MALPWYNAGTISVSNGSSNVVGSGTAWVANVDPHEGIFMPDGNIYEIDSITDDTHLTLATNYLGTDVTSLGAYSIVPIQGYIRDLASQVAELIALTGAIVGQAPIADGILQYKSSSWTVRTPAQYLTDLAKNFSEVTIPSTSTCDIGVATNPKVLISGTTTITSFGTTANALRFLRFGGALTLTHNSTSLILPGGANIITAAGDTCILLSDSSGNWRVWNYTRASGANLVDTLGEVTIASASTVNLGATAAERVLVTGTTTITSFGTTVNQPFKIVRFSGVLTLTHNATSLILLTGANRTTVAGDIGIYGSDSSGNWREISYSRISTTGATLDGTETLTNKTLTAPTINGGTATALTGLGIRSTGAAYDLTLASTEVFTAGRTLTITVNDTSRTLTLNGNPTLSGLTTTGSGTLALGSKTLTVSNTVTLSGTDSATLTFGAGGTIAYTANKLSVFATTSSSELAGIMSDETGSGALVFATSPTLVTPVLGVATATSINKVAITAPASSATLTIADGKTLTVSNTLTFTGTDTSSVAFGTGGTVVYTSNDLSVFASTTSLQLKTLISDETGSGALVFATSPTLVTPVLGVASATSINKVAITAPASSATLTIADGKTLTVNNSITFAGTDSTTMTFPSTSATLARTDAGNTFTGHQTFEGVTATGATGTGNMVFSAGPTFTAISVTGLVDLSGAAAGQVKFPATQNASSDANTLDDYEEGTWTPVFNRTATYTNQTGYYIKIGTFITASYSLITSSTTSNGGLAISSLPYASATITNAGGGGCVSSFTGVTLTTNYYSLGILLVSASTNANIYMSGNNNATTLLSGNALANPTFMAGTINYIAGA